LTFTLTLFRHAKSSWDDTVPRDFDRPLNKRGEKAAVTMGVWVKRNGLTFDHVVASPAVRVIETIDQFVKGTSGRMEPNWDRRIYLASSATLMDVLRDQSDEHKNLLMVGHNPGLEDLVFDMTAVRLCAIWSGKNIPPRPLRGWSSTSRTGPSWIANVVSSPISSGRVISTLNLDPKTNDARYLA
jgi:phosphohistidine phosphatase SixA